MDSREWTDFVGKFNCDFEYGKLSTWLFTHSLSNWHEFSKKVEVKLIFNTPQYPLHNLSHLSIKKVLLKNIISDNLHSDVATIKILSNLVYDWLSNGKSLHLTLTWLHVVISTINWFPLTIKTGQSIMQRKLAHDCSFALVNCWLLNLFYQYTPINFGELFDEEYFVSI